MHSSNPVTVKLHAAVLPEASVAVQVTVLTPSGKHDPDGGLQAVVTPGQLSEAVGGGKVATTQFADVQVVCGETAVTAAGQVIVGGCVSWTVTVNVQVEPPPPVSSQPFTFITMCMFGKP